MSTSTHFWNSRTVANEIVKRMPEQFITEHLINESQTVRLTAMTSDFRNLHTTDDIHYTRRVHPRNTTSNYYGIYKPQGNTNKKLSKRRSKSIAQWIYNSAQNLSEKSNGKWLLLQICKVPKVDTCFLRNWRWISKIVQLSHIAKRTDSQ